MALLGNTFMGLFNRTIPKANEWWSLHWARAQELELGANAPIQRVIDEFLTEFKASLPATHRKIYEAYWSAVGDSQNGIESTASEAQAQAKIVAEIKGYVSKGWLSRLFSRTPANYSEWQRVILYKELQDGLTQLKEGSLLRQDSFSFLKPLTQFTDVLSTVMKQAGGKPWLDGFSYYYDLAPKNTSFPQQLYQEMRNSFLSLKKFVSFALYHFDGKQVKEAIGAAQENFIKNSNEWRRKFIGYPSATPDEFRKNLDRVDAINTAEDIVYHGMEVGMDMPFYGEWQQCQLPTYRNELYKIQEAFFANKNVGQLTSSLKALLDKHAKYYHMDNSGNAGLTAYQLTWVPCIRAEMQEIMLRYIDSLDLNWARRIFVKRDVLKALDKSYSELSTSHALVLSQASSVPTAPLMQSTEERALRDFWYDYRDGNETQKKVGNGGVSERQIGWAEEFLAQRDNLDKAKTTSAKNHVIIKNKNANQPRIAFLRRKLHPDVYQNKGTKYQEIHKRIAGPVFSDMEEFLEKGEDLLEGRISKDDFIAYHASLPKRRALIVTEAEYESCRLTPEQILQGALRIITSEHEARRDKEREEDRAKLEAAREKHNAEIKAAQEKHNAKVKVAQEKHSAKIKAAQDRERAAADKRWSIFQAQIEGAKQQYEKQQTASPAAGPQLEEEKAKAAPSEGAGSSPSLNLPSLELARETSTGLSAPLIHEVPVISPSAKAPTPPPHGEVVTEQEAGLGSESGSASPTDSTNTSGAGSPIPHTNSQTDFFKHLPRSETTAQHDSDTNSIGVGAKSKTAEDDAEVVKNTVQSQGFAYGSDK